MTRAKMAPPRAENGRVILTIPSGEPGVAMEWSLSVDAAAVIVEGMCQAIAEARSPGEAAAAVTWIAPEVRRG